MKLLDTSKVGMRFAGTARALSCATWLDYAATSAHASAPAAVAQRKRRTGIAASVDRSII
jgi:hypothetical protein